MHQLRFVAKNALSKNTFILKPSQSSNERASLKELILLDSDLFSYSHCL